MARRMVAAAQDASATVPADWQEAVPELREGQHLSVLAAVARQRAKGTVYPPESLVFNALHLTPLPSVRVVIVGQDPYHGPGQAHGLAFSVPEGAVDGGVKMPPSLRNIFKELATEFPGSPEFPPTDLSRWARQGVLLLNTTLTVDAGKAASHAGLGWAAITDAILRTVSEQCAPAVFLLWGAHAQQKAALVDAERHLVLQSAHPSPLSAHRGFFGCGHFAQANAWLAERGREAIVW